MIWPRYTWIGLCPLEIRCTQMIAMVQASRFQRALAVSRSGGMTFVPALIEVLFRSGTL